VLKLRNQKLLMCQSVFKYHTLLWSVAYQWPDVSYSDRPTKTNIDLGERKKDKEREVRSSKQGLRAKQRKEGLVLLGQSSFLSQEQSNGR